MNRHRSTIEDLAVAGIRCGYNISTTPESISLDNCLWVVTVEFWGSDKFRVYAEGGGSEEGSYVLAALRCLSESANKTEERTMAREWADALWQSRQRRHSRFLETNQGLDSAEDDSAPTGR